MTDLQSQAFKAVVNRPSLLLMLVGSVQLLGSLWAGVKYPDTATWILAFNSVVGFLFLAAGMGFMFYGTKKREEQTKPVIPITHKQRQVCGVAREWMALDSAARATAERFDGCTFSEAVQRFNLGVTQGLCEFREHSGVAQMRSISDHTVMPDDEVIT